MTAQSETEKVLNPYVPPGDDADDFSLASPVIATAAGYQDQTLLVRILIVCIGLQALADGFNALACGALALANLSWELEGQLVSVTGSCAQLNWIVYLVGIIPFAIFLVRANQNARAFAAATRTDERDDLWRRPIDAFTPASMFWWFLVPFFNLVRPYQAVRAVWLSSAPENAGIESTDRKGVLSLWWAAWVIVLFWSRLSTVLTQPEADPVTHNIVVAVGGVLGGALCFLALRVVLALHDRQQRRARELWT